MLVLLIGFLWILTALTALTLGADIDDEKNKRASQAARLTEAADDAWIGAAPAPAPAPTAQPITLSLTRHVNLVKRPRPTLVETPPVKPTLTLVKRPRKPSAPWLPQPLKTVPIAPLSLALSHWQLAGSHDVPFEPARHKATKGGFQRLNGKRWVFISRLEESEVKGILTI